MILTLPLLLQPSPVERTLAETDAAAGRGGWGRSLLGHRCVPDSLHDAPAECAIDPDLFDGASARAGGPFFRNVVKGKKKAVL